jgi:beta-galactosidase GanA
MKAALLGALCASFLLGASALAQDGLTTAAGGKPRLMVDGRPFLVLGVQLNNSSGYPAALHALGPAVERSHANTVMAPIGWESIEPVEGRYDFSLIDGLVAEARTQKVRLALLWFGSWKNGAMSYTPAWVKRDTVRFPRVMTREGRAIEALSPIGAASRDADARAFGAVMAHLRAIDGKQKTVIMVQVENEAGVLGSDRDYSPMAQALYDAPVPADLPGARPGGWTQNYAERAPEAFMAYHTARYVGAVAAAGKAAYGLPLYVNVWPREQPGLERPGESSPSGGAVSWLLPQWRALAPAVDIVGVDNYDINVAPYTAIARAYDVPGNPLFVPETGGSMAHARHAFWTIAQPHSVGISKFGLDDQFGLKDGREVEEPMAATYRLLGPAASVLLPLRDEGKIGVAVEEDGLANIPLPFSAVDLVARFGEVRDGYGGPRGQGNKDLSGRVLVAEAAPDRFYVTGTSANLKFSPKLGQTGSVQLVTVQEGRFEAGAWIGERLLNGDETAFGLILPKDGRSLLVTVQVNP